VLKTYTPQAAELQKYIAMFYVFTNDKPRKFSYYVFPHTYTNISFIKSASVGRDNYEITIESTKATLTNFAVEITGKYTRPLIVNYAGDFDEISVIFKPLGVNHFFSQPLTNIANQYSQKLNSKPWVNACKALFTYNTVEEKLAFIEQFLMANFLPKDYNLLEKSISLLENIEQDYTIEAVASIVGVSTKTLARKFQQELCCTPSEYKRISRFRHAVNTKLLTSELKSLTDISYQSNFYDQSYFIKEFKKLTRLNPKKFFDTITTFEENKIIWEVR